MLLRRPHTIERATRGAAREKVSLRIAHGYSFTRPREPSRVFGSNPVQQPQRAIGTGLETKDPLSIT